MAKHGILDVAGGTIYLSLHVHTLASVKDLVASIHASAVQSGNYGKVWQRGRGRYFRGSWYGCVGSKAYILACKKLSRLVRREAPENLSRHQQSGAKVPRCARARSLAPAAARRLFMPGDLLPAKRTIYLDVFCYMILFVSTPAMPCHVFVVTNCAEALVAWSSHALLDSKGCSILRLAYGLRASARQGSTKKTGKFHPIYISGERADETSTEKSSILFSRIKGCADSENALIALPKELPALHVFNVRAGRVYPHAKQLQHSLMGHVYYWRTHLFLYWQTCSYRLMLELFAMLTDLAVGDGNPLPAGLGIQAVGRTIRNQQFAHTQRSRAPLHSDCSVRLT
ncbi:hypothetical protein FISHEDRAFT_54855 [Fistulina hepatica ATCC 64428]|uniref:Uncharacterized protein n=1 Tax=Fistulina hepatica ATCC 64428 TaxID=1128425 RepID=A0A0D7ARB2_9AGAR|nr:hypothetical protein FISHEDRAFT_54855 [Fistulina hepatica ATCC 64428]